MFLFLTFKKSENHQVGPNLPHSSLPSSPVDDLRIIFVQSSPAVLDTNGLPNVVYDVAKISGLLLTTWQENNWLENKFSLLQNVGGCQCLCRKYTEKTHIKYTSPPKEHIQKLKMIEITNLG